MKLEDSLLVYVPISTDRMNCARLVVHRSRMSIKSAMCVAGSTEIGSTREHGQTPHPRLSS